MMPLSCKRGGRSACCTPSAAETTETFCGLYRHPIETWRREKGLRSERAIALHSPLAKFQIEDLIQ